jgi:hypothetical protein
MKIGFTPGKLVISIPHRLKCKIPDLKIGGWAYTQ